jgi:hypothetical protein
MTPAAGCRGEHAPGLLVVARLGVEQPALDVLAGRAGVVAGRQAVDVHRPHGAPAAGVVGEARAGSRVIANGLAIITLPPGPAARPQQPEALDVAVGQRLDAGDDVGAAGGLEQVREALLRLEVLLDRQLPADLRHAVTSPCSASKTGKIPSPWPGAPCGSCPPSRGPSPAGRARGRGCSARRGNSIARRPWPPGRAARRRWRWRRRGSRAPWRSAAGSCPGRSGCPARRPAWWCWCAPPAASPTSAARPVFM